MSFALQCGLVRTAKGAHVCANQRQFIIVSRRRQSFVLICLGNPSLQYLAMDRSFTKSSGRHPTNYKLDLILFVLFPALFTILIFFVSLVFALLISTGAALIFGLIPALYVARADVNDALKAAGRTSSPSW